MAAHDSPPSDEGFAASLASPPRSLMQLVLGICALLLGVGLAIGGLAGIFLIHTNGVGRLLGFGIVLGLGMSLHGWTMLIGKRSG